MKEDAEPGDDVIVVPLSKPVAAHGQTVSRLVLRRPLGADFIACGYPLIMIAPSEVPQDDDGNFVDDAPSDIGSEFRPNASAVAKLVSRCGGVPPSTVKALDGADFNTCLMAIISFLGVGERAKKSSTPVSTSPASGDDLQPSI